jgi:Ca2+-binding RTX toxin-like protein
MTIKIKLSGPKGVDYNAYIEGYFADFVTSGWPYILGGSNTYKGKQIVLLDELETKPAKTKALVLDGKDFFYYFTGHTLSGKLTAVSLATLGKSYDPKDGSFDTGKDGRIKNVSTVVEFSGLNISNKPEVKGALHKTIYALMGGEHDGGGLSDPSLLFNVVNAQGHKVTGTKKGDSYVGTAFADKVDLGKGSDTLNGAGGKDTLIGGKGKDAFVFDSAIGSGNVDKIKDFSPKDDTIRLDAAVFAGLAAGALVDSAFARDSAADKPAERIIYDDQTGALFFDADGSGNGAAIRFATLGKGLDLTADDFFVI